MAAASLEKIIYYVCVRYPHRHELSKARVTKTVYLADVEAARRTGRKVTAIDWWYNHYGPYVEDVHRAALALQDQGLLRVVDETNFHGQPKTRYEVVKEEKLELPIEVRSVLDQVIEETAPMYWDAFMRYVYSTPPMKDTEQYGRVDVEGVMRRERQELLRRSHEELHEKYGTALKQLAEL